MSSSAATLAAEGADELAGTPPRLCYLLRLLVSSSLYFLPSALRAQALKAGTAEIRRYAIEVAGLCVGTMTATRQPQADADVLYTLVSDVKVNSLLYHLKIYYQVSNRFRTGQI